MTHQNPIIDEDGNQYDDLLYKRCTKCLDIKPNEEFYKRYNGKNGVKPECKKCSSIYGKKHHWRSKGGIPSNYDLKLSLYIFYCPYCGQKSTSITSTKIYCSLACQQKAVHKRGYGQEPVISLIEALQIEVAKGHYICLCTPDSEADNNRYGACINAGQIPASHQRITRFYYNNNPARAILQAVIDHSQQIEQETEQS